MKNQKIVFVCMAALIFSFLFSACSGIKLPKGTTILYQGHASLRIITKDGIVIYVDPYFGGGYDIPADIILVTHGHFDHDIIDLPEKKDDCVIITCDEAVIDKAHKFFSMEGFQAIVDDVHQTFSIKGVEIEATFTSNTYHSFRNITGFLITVDGFLIYVAGENQSITDQMYTFSELGIDYAFIPFGYGERNPSIQESIEIAKIIGAKHNIPYHTEDHADIVMGLNREAAESFDVPNRLILEPGELIYLEH